MGTTGLFPKVTVMVTDLANIAICNDGPARFQISGQAVGIATIGGAMQYNTAYAFFGTPLARRPGKRQGSP
jgi:hypothetical protein